MAVDVIKKIAKKLRRAEEPKIEDEEELIIDEPEEKEEKGVDEEFKDTVMERLGAIDDDVARLKVSINTVRKDITELRNELGRMDESLKDIMMLYEVVSTQINPFIGESKVTAASIEKLERLSEEVKEIKNTLEDVLIDLRLIVLRELDIRSIVMEVLQEE